MSDWMLACLGELGEAANIQKKLNRLRDGLRNKEDAVELRAKFKSEIGDTMLYLDLVAQAAGFSLEEAAQQSFNDKCDEIGYKGARL